MTQLNSSVDELREDIPLRNNNTKDYRFWRCLECRNTTECFTGLGLIYTSFAIISISVTFLLMLQIYYGAHQLEAHGSVVSDYDECSSIGTSILQMGGNSMDAAIAATICMAVVNPHTTGLAAGGVLMIYNHRLRSPPNVVDFGPSVNLNTDVLPRLITGLAYAHKQFGRLPWHSLLVPSINLARNGFLVSETLATAINVSKKFNLYGALSTGQKLQLLPLAATLELYANISDEQFNSLITLDFSPEIKSAINLTFYGYNIYVPDLPTIGPTLLTVLDNLNKYINVIDSNQADYVLHLAQIILNTYESLNIYKRPYEVTASVVAATDVQDLYVSIVTGLNGMLGSYRILSAGYILDSPPALKYDQQLEDTSFLPIIITNNKYVCAKRFIFGSGDVSLAAQLITNLLLHGVNLTEAIEAPRFRVLVDKDEIGIEEKHLFKFTENQIGDLQSLGNLTLLDEPYDGINGIQLYHDDVDLYCDSRTGGKPSRI